MATKVKTFCVFVGLAFFLILIYPGSAVAQVNCDFVVSRSTSSVNGRYAPYNQIRPGNTLCLEAGVRGPLTFSNIKGTIDNPIKITNYGGKVILNDSSSWVGFFFQNSQHFRFTGTGSTDQYGIQIQKAVTFGMLLVAKTEYFEIDHVEINELLGSSIGIHSMTNTTCPGSPDYDYNFDGLYNSLDAVTRDNFVQHNVSVHDNLFQGFVRNDGTYSLDMAMYIGNSNYSDGYPKTCNGSSVWTYDPVLEGLYIYNNRMDTLGDKVLQVGSATRDCRIYLNTVNKGAQVEPTDTGGININPGSNCIVERNKITNTKGHGIIYQGNGGKIINNLIANVGHPTSYWRDGIYVTVKPAGYTHGKSTYVLNNTIVNPVGYGITFGANEGTPADPDRIQNNIIVNPGWDIYIYTPVGTDYVKANNYTTFNLDDVKFKNPSLNDYSLLLTSPAINTGANLSAYGVTNDINGTGRPQGTAYDIGAYEYLSGTLTSSPTPLPTATFTVTPTIIPGDANRDGRVDGVDYIIWLNHYNQNTSAGYRDGDFNNSGKVDGVDYVVWLSNYHL